MLKKWLLNLVFSYIAFWSPSSLAGNTKDLELSVMKASLCLHWDCPSIYMQATGLSHTVKQLDQKLLLQTMNSAQADARFFAEKVISSEAGEHPGQLYKSLQILVGQNSRLTTRVGSREEPVETQGQHILNMDHHQALHLKIDGRPLISKELALAHQATQSLILEGIIPPPKNQWDSATDARLLNHTLITAISKQRRN